MSALLNFIWKHHFTFLFLLFESFTFLLIVQTNKFHNSSFLHASTAVSGKAFTVVNNITEYVELKKVNEQLAKENAKLITLSRNAFIPRDKNFVLINDTLYQQQYRYLSARVISSSVNKRNNYIILDQGSAQGVEPQMGVISGSGMVGIVRDVSKNFCSVISVLHKDIRIIGKLQKNEYFGPITWDGKDPLFATLSDIPGHVRLIKGDTVVTRGASIIFPAAVPAGFVEEFSQPAGSNFFEVKIRLSTDFYSVSHVYIVKNLMKEEMMELETKAVNIE